MAFFAKRLSDDRITRPSQAEKSDRLVCLGCGDEMVLYDSFETKNGTFVSSHFKHKRDSCGYGGVGSGGESEQHERMKEIALHKLQWEFDLARSTLEQQVGENIADVYARFEDSQHPYGNGIVVEVQYKNDGKDIEAVTENYLKHGYSVCWVWEEQYDGRDVDLFGGQVNTVWPEAVPSMLKWEHGPQHWREPIGPSYPPNVTVPARLPTAWYDEQSHRIWRSQDWYDVFPDASGYESEYSIQDVQDTLEDPGEIEVTLAPEIVAQLEYNRLKDKYAADSIEDLRRTLWNASWHRRFTDDASQYYPDPTPHTSATVHLPTWLADDGVVARESGPQSGCFGIFYEDPTEVTPKPPAKEYLIPESLLEDFADGVDIMAQYPDLAETIDKVVRIVGFNTDNRVQPETARISSIRQIAHNAGVSPDKSQLAITVAIEAGKLEKVDDRIKVND
ncbi:hypothetical protein [Natrinema hispanicum]|nr:hypothetical protein [Natrinema hispanicum]